MSAFYPGVEFGFRKGMYPDLATKKCSLDSLSHLVFFVVAVPHGNAAQKLQWSYLNRSRKRHKIRAMNAAWSSCASFCFEYFLVSLSGAAPQGIEVLSWYALCVGSIRASLPIP